MWTFLKKQKQSLKSLFSTSVWTFISLLLKYHFINILHYFCCKYYKSVCLCISNQKKKKKMWKKNHLCADIFFFAMAEMACEIWNQTNECQRKHANKGLRHSANHLTSAKRLKVTDTPTHHLVCIEKKIILASKIIQNYDAKYHVNSIFIL